jgi:hypothetical protein
MLICDKQGDKQGDKQADKQYNIIYLSISYYTDK